MFRSISLIFILRIQNFYAVIAGEKTFTMFPPTDCLFMPRECQYPTSKYHLKSGASSEGRINKEDLVLSTEGTPSPSLSWLNFDPDIPSTSAGKDCRNLYLSHPLRCNLKAGEILYIPSLWYHRVSQTQLTIAVNYWYEQRFDFRYVFYKTVQALSDCRRQDSTAADTPSP